MSTPVVINFDRTKIPNEGDPQLREHAEYLWRLMPNVIDSMNSAILWQNTTSNNVESFKESAKSSADSASASRNDVISAKSDVASMKADIVTMKEHIDGINDGINSAISNAVNSQLGEFTDKIRQNSVRRKMQSFGLNLI